MPERLAAARASRENEEVQQQQPQRLNKQLATVSGVGQLLLPAGAAADSASTGRPTAASQAPGETHSPLYSLQANLFAQAALPSAGTPARDRATSLDLGAVSSMGRAPRASGPAPALVAPSFTSAADAHPKAPTALQGALAWGSQARPTSSGTTTPWAGQAQQSIGGNSTPQPWAGQARPPSGTVPPWSTLARASQANSGSHSQVVDVTNLQQLLMPPWRASNAPPQQQQLFLSTTEQQQAQVEEDDANMLAKELREQAPRIGGDAVMKSGSANGGAATAAAAAAASPISRSSTGRGTDAAGSPCSTDHTANAAGAGADASSLDRRPIHKRVNDLFSQRVPIGVGACSGASSFSMRNTPSDLDILAEDDESIVMPLEQRSSLDVDHGPPSSASKALRLKHRPGHRRPPNRHASMPTVSRGHPAPGNVLSVDSAPQHMEMREHPHTADTFDDDMPEPPEPAICSGNCLLASPAQAMQPDGGLAVRAGGGRSTASQLQHQVSDSISLASQMSRTSSVGLLVASGAVARQPHMAVAPSSAAAQYGGGAAGHLGGSMTSSSGLPVLSHQQQLQQQHVGSRLAVLTTTRLSFESEVAGAPGGSGNGVAGTAANPSLLLSTQRSIRASDAGPWERTSTAVSGRLPSVANTAAAPASAAPAHSQSLVSLHRAVERLMLQDSSLYAKVHASLKGISSLAKETRKLDFGRDLSGATTINQYVVVKTLGRGSFGKVKLCLNTLDGQLYAVKMVNRAHILKQLQKPVRALRRRAPPGRNSSDTGLMAGMTRTNTDGSMNLSSINNTPPPPGAMPSRMSMDDTSPLTAVMREIAVMKKVDHPNVVRMREVIDPPGSSHLMLVMEYCDGGCVMETRSQAGFRRMTEEEACHFFRQACCGLDYLHYNSIVHGDLKPENLLVSGPDAVLKIADFGSSRVIGGEAADATKTTCTPAFQAPEEVGRMTVDPYLADLWALGCCLYCFVCGRLPFVGSCVVDVYRSILTKPLEFPRDVDISPPLRQLLALMLEKDPLKRLKLAGVMAHPWVTMEGAAPLVSMRAMTNAPAIIRVSHAEQVNAIDRNSLVSLIRARLKEKTLQAGEYLFREGEEAHCVFMIMAGVVELTHHISAHTRSLAAHAANNAAGGTGTPSTPAASRGQSTFASAADAAAAGGGEAFASAATLAVDSGAAGGGHHTQEDGSFSVDLDESLTLDHAEDGQMLTSAMNIVDGKLHIDRKQALEMRRRMQGSVLGEDPEYVVEVKGPGSVVGQVSLDNAASHHRHSARARDAVTVVKLTEENFIKALLAMYGPGGPGPGTNSLTNTMSSTSDLVQQAMAVASGSFAIGYGPAPQSQQGGPAPGQLHSGTTSGWRMGPSSSNLGIGGAGLAAASAAAAAAAMAVGGTGGGVPAAAAGRSAGAPTPLVVLQTLEDSGGNNVQSPAVDPARAFQMAAGRFGLGNMRGGGAATAAATATAAGGGGNSPCLLSGSTIADSQHGDGDLGPLGLASASSRRSAAAGGGSFLVRQDSRRRRGSNAPFSTLGLLNTIQSVNASHGGQQSSEGVADL